LGTIVKEDSAFVVFKIISVMATRKRRSFIFFEQKINQPKVKFKNYFLGSVLSASSWSILKISTNEQQREKKKN
jgi:hypothetical protein